MHIARVGTGRSISVSTGLWMAFVAVASLGLSRAFACVMPMAAVAVVAAMTTSRAQSVVLVLIAWLGQQAIGFGLLHYPHTASTVGWGGAIGLAAMAALSGAWAVRRWIGLRGPIRAVLALVVAFAGYEGVLFAATSVLPSGPGAFAWAVMFKVLVIDAVALGLLLAVHRAKAGLAAMVRRSVPHHDTWERGRELRGTPL